MGSNGNLKYRLSLLSIFFDSNNSCTLFTHDLLFIGYFDDKIAYLG